MTNTKKIAFCAGALGIIYLFTKSDDNQEEEPAGRIFPSIGFDFDFRNDNSKTRCLKMNNVGCMDRGEAWLGMETSRIVNPMNADVHGKEG